MTAKTVEADETVAAKNSRSGRAQSKTGETDETVTAKNGRSGRDRDSQKQ